VINEVCTNPGTTDNAPDGVIEGDSAVELFNSGDETLDLSPYRLCANTTCLWQEGAVQPFAIRSTTNAGLGWTSRRGRQRGEAGAGRRVAGCRSGQADRAEPGCRRRLGGGYGCVAGVCAEVSPDVFWGNGWFE
jgi:hypothetical protein